MVFLTKVEMINDALEEVNYLKYLLTDLKARQTSNEKKLARRMAEITGTKNRMDCILQEVQRSS